MTVYRNILICIASIIFSSCIGTKGISKPKNGETAKEYSERVIKALKIPAEKLYYATNIETGEKPPPEGTEGGMLNFVKNNNSATYHQLPDSSLNKDSIEDDLQPYNGFNLVVIKQLLTRKSLKFNEDKLLGILLYSDMVAKYIDYNKYISLLNRLEEDGVPYVVLIAEGADSITDIEDIQGN